MRVDAGQMQDDREQRLPRPAQPFASQCQTSGLFSTNILLLLLLLLFSMSEAPLE